MVVVRRLKLSWKAAACWGLFVVVVGLGAFLAVRWWRLRPPPFPPKAWTQEIRRWEREAEKNPTNRRAWLRLAQLAEFTRDNEGAIRYWERAMQLDEQDPGGWVQLGRAYARQGDFQQALRCYEECVKRSSEAAPQSLRPLYSEISLLNLELGHDKEALEAAKKALGPDEPTSRPTRERTACVEQIGICEWALGHRQRALERFEQAAAGGSVTSEDYLSAVKSGQELPDELRRQVTARIAIVRETMDTEGSPLLPKRPPPVPWESSPAASSSKNTE